MCGILAVLVNEDTELNIESEFKQILNEMRHRGPDAVKTEKFVHKSNGNKSIIFGHHRLAIIDLSDAGIQPMSTEDGRLTIIYNGEIYNYIELRNELVELGEVFTTNTDTEVLLKGYRKFGVEFLSRLNGMFAFIIWDDHKEELLVVRDRFGIKPLYYSSFKDYFIISSEMKPILKIRGKNISPNNDKIWDYLSYGAVDRTDDTFFKEIRRFPAAHYAIISSKEDYTFTKYWNLKEEVQKLRIEDSFKEKSLEEHVNAVREIFFRAVQLRLRSDVTVGSCLSGGIDSSSVVSVIGKILPEDKQDIFQTFSIVFDESFVFSEKKFVEMVTVQTHTNNNTYTPTINDIDTDFSDFIWYQEEPVESMSPFGQFCVMRLASEKGVTVLLDGQGADETLAGYFPLSTYYFYELFKKFRWLTLIKELKASRYKRNVKSFFAQFLPKFVHKRVVSRYKGETKYLQKEFIVNHSKQALPTLMLRRHELDNALMTTLEFSFQHLLRYEDRNSMAFSLEARVPFLDHNLVTYILALPSSYIIKNGVTKWIFRKALEGTTPQSILDRYDKIGFAVPEVFWLQKSDPKFLAELENTPHPFMQQYVELNKIKELCSKRKTLRANELKFLFRVACFNIWLKLFFESNTEISMK